MSIEELPSRTMMAFRHPGDEWDGYAALIVAAYVDHTLSTAKEHDARKTVISFSPSPRLEAGSWGLWGGGERLVEKKRGTPPPPTPSLRLSPPLPPIPPAP